MLLNRIKLKGTIINSLTFVSLQAFWVFTVSLPLIFINAQKYDEGTTFGALDYVGAVIFAVGLVVETVADQQKFAFRNNPENKGKWCQVGKDTPDCCDFLKSHPTSRFDMLHHHLNGLKGIV